MMSTISLRIVLMGMPFLINRCETSSIKFFGYYLQLDVVENIIERILG